MDVAHKTFGEKGNYLHMCHQQGARDTLIQALYIEHGKGIIYCQNFHFGNVECVQTDECVV